MPLDAHLSAAHRVAGDVARVRADAGLTGETKAAAQMRLRRRGWREQRLARVTSTTHSLHLPFLRQEVGTCIPATKDLVFYEPDDLWDQVVHSIGQDILGPAIKTRHLPENPSLN